MSLDFHARDMAVGNAVRACSEPHQIPGLFYGSKTMESEQLPIVFLLERFAETKTPLSNKAKDYLNFIDLTRCLAQNTILAYGRNLCGFVHFCCSHHIRTIKEIKTDTVLAYLAKLKKEGKSSKTLYAAFVAIKMLIKFAIMTGVESKHFSRILCMPTIKVDQKLPRILTIKQVAKLLKSPKKGSRFYYRNRAILELLYDTGIRESEIIDLTLSQIDLDEGFIVVSGKGSKERMIPLTANAVRVIYAYIHSERMLYLRGRKDIGYLFLSKSNRALWRHDLWRIVSKCAKDAGLANVSPHILRHCFATHMLIGGADLRSIQKALGHSSIATTQIYTHVDISQLRSVIEKCHPRSHTKKDSTD